MTEFSDEQKNWIGKEGAILSHVLVMLEILHEIPAEAFEDDGSRLVTQFDFLAKCANVHDFLFNLYLLMRVHTSPCQSKIIQHLVERMNLSFPDLKAFEPVVFKKKTEFSLSWYMTIFAGIAYDLEQTLKPEEFNNTHTFLEHISDRFNKMIVLEESKINAWEQANEKT